MDLISIITACYNNGSFLKETVESVFSQTHQNWEWIIVNDNSTDHSVEILASLNDQRIRVIFLESNVGVSQARNAGLQIMRGDYFCLLDGDDVLPPKSLEARLSVFAKNPDIAFVDGVVSIRDENLQTETNRYTPDFRGRPLACLISLSGECFFGPSWMIRVNKNKEYRFQPGLTHGEELLFYLMISDSGLYDFTHETVLHYRRHRNSAMRNLRGLEKGYRTIANTLASNNKFPKNQVRQFVGKARTIVCKSYLRQGQILSAIKTFINPWT